SPVSSSSRGPRPGPAGPLRVAPARRPCSARRGKTPAGRDILQAPVDRGRWRHRSLAPRYRVTAMTSAGEGPEGAAPLPAPGAPAAPRPRREPVRVLLVDDHQMVIDGLRAMLANHAARVEVVGACSTLEETLAAVETAAPDIVVVDVRLRGQSG